MKVYIAGRSEDRAKILEIKKEFEAAEIEVCSDWITQEGDLKTPDEPEEAQKRVNLDLRQVAEGDIFVLFKPKESHRDSSGGHHVETGAALILGKPVFLIGSTENLFHGHENVRVFDSVQAAIQAVLCFKPEEFRPSTHSVDSYQKWTRTTALYPGKGEKKTFGIAYLTVGLGGETGEVAEKVMAHLMEESNRLLMKGGVQTDAETVALTNLGTVIQKLHYLVTVGKQLEELKRPMREGKMPLPDLAPLPEETLVALNKEYGDVSWYLVRSPDELGIRSSDVLASNVEKLMDRKRRDALHGVGDNR